MKCETAMRKREVKTVVEVEVVVLELSMEEARVLRDLWGKSADRLAHDLSFLGTLDGLFPYAHMEPSICGFRNVRADY